MMLYLKQPTLTLVIKKYVMDKEDMKNFYPISSLFFISKVVNKGSSKACRRTTVLLVHSDFHDNYHSAYHRGHLIKTVLLKVLSDIAETLDEGSMAALIILDLCVVFYVIDH